MTGRYVYHTIEFTVAHCQILSYKKQIWGDFSKLNLDIQMDYKTDIDEKKTAMGALLHNTTLWKLQ